jgi:hypothetical protein
LKGLATGDISFHKLRRGATGRLALRENAIGRAAAFNGPRPSPVGRKRPARDEK